MKFFSRKVATTEECKPDTRAASGLGRKFKSLFGLGDKLDANSRTELEEILLLADTGVDTTELILSKLDEQVNKKHLPLEALGLILADILKPAQTELIPEGDPWVILVVGSNGVGKTTTVAKLANYYMKQGYKPLLAAGDTFRAAAIEQLESWASLLNVPVVSQKAGADSASVIYDSIKAAAARGCNIVLADTAGRLHNKTQLLDELGKVKKVAGRATDGAPHQTLLVVDANMGQNSIQMTETFLSCIGVTGLIMTKLDGSAKGGTIFSLCNGYKLPVPFVGTGEKLDDLRRFNAEAYVSSMLT